jgi:hypothetical protein
MDLAAAKEEIEKTVAAMEGSLRVVWREYPIRYLMQTISDSVRKVRHWLNCLETLSLLVDGVLTLQLPELHSWYDNSSLLCCQPPSHSTRPVKQPLTPSFAEFQKHWINMHQLYFSGLLQQVADTRTGRLPSYTIQEYLDLRVRTIGVYPAIALTQYAEGVTSLPEPILQHPSLQECMRVCAELVVLYVGRAVYHTR